MFEKKHAEQINYDSTLGPEILRFLSRMETVENNAGIIRNSMDMKSLEWDSFMSEIKRESLKAREELAIIKEKVKSFKQDFMSLVSDFRTKANSEDFDKLKMKIDSFGTEKFMSRDEFDRLISDRFR